MNAVDLYDRTMQPRRTIEEGRMWLLDCFGDSDEVECIRSLNAVGVISAVDRLHEGGWIEFARTQNAWSGLTPREREHAA